MAKSSGSPGSPKAKTVSPIIALHDSWKAKSGQHVTISIDAQQAWWPSDTGMPIGALRANQQTMQEMLVE
ncbi:hypothetical protein [Corynebacterium sp. HMSC28B08]|uniref:hypothetical protein n=1 Tax=Corynebacterium TaxID=1716 RepID=UPI00114C875A|nr:hypothetical protein [Corynebacterium sp. HMSC28B08]